MDLNIKLSDPVTISLCGLGIQRKFAEELALKEKFSKDKSLESRYYRMLYILTRGVFPSYVAPCFIAEILYELFSCLKETENVILDSVTQDVLDSFNCHLFYGHQETLRLSTMVGQHLVCPPNLLCNERSIMRFVNCLKNKFGGFSYIPETAFDLGILSKTIGSKAIIEPGPALSFNVSYIIKSYSPLLEVKEKPVIPGIIEEEDIDVGAEYNDPLLDEDVDEMLSLMSLEADLKGKHNVIVHEFEIDDDCMPEVSYGRVVINKFEQKNIEKTEKENLKILGDEKFAPMLLNYSKKCGNGSSLSRKCLDVPKPKLDKNGIGYSVPKDSSLICRTYKDVKYYVNGYLVKAPVWVVKKSVPLYPSYSDVISFCFNEIRRFSPSYIRRLRQKHKIGGFTQHCLVGLKHCFKNGNGSFDYFPSCFSKFGYHLRFIKLGFLTLMDSYVYGQASLYSFIPYFEKVTGVPVRS